MHRVLGLSPAQGFTRQALWKERWMPRAAGICANVIVGEQHKASEEGSKDIRGRWTVRKW